MSPECLGHNGPKYTSLLTQQASHGGYATGFRATNMTNSRHEVFVTNLVFGLALVPHIEFVAKEGSDMQPIAALLAMGWIGITSYKHPKVRKHFPALLLLLISLTLFVYYLLSFFGARDVLGNTIAFGSYLVGPVLLVFFYTRVGLISPGLLSASIFFILGIALVQVSGISGLQAAVEAVFSPVLSRFTGVQWEGARGAPSIYSEPSHAARYIFLLSGFTLALWYVGRLSIRRTRLLLVALVFSALLVKAGTFVLLALMLGLGALIASFRPRLRLILPALVAVILLGLGIVFAATVSPEASRVGEISAKLLQVPDQIGQVDIYYLENFGGPRFVTVIVAYASVTLHPFGQGLASYFETFGATALALGVDLERLWYFGVNSVDSKPNAYAAQLAYDTGVFGVVIGGVILVYSILWTRKHYTREAIWTLFPFVGAMQILIASLTTIPVPWMLLSLTGLARKGYMGGKRLHHPTAVTFAGQYCPPVEIEPISYVSHQNPYTFASGAFSSDSNRP